MCSMPLKKVKETFKIKLPMKTFMNKLTDLRSSAEITIANLIVRHHVKSKVQPDTYVLSLENTDFLTQKPTIHGDKVVEVAENRLIDDLGNDYMFCTLPVETVLEVTDHLLKKLDDIVPRYELQEDAINILDDECVKINQKIPDNEMFEYRIIDRENFLDDLAGWIGEANESNKTLMKHDQEILMKVTDDYIFSSISTNEYIYEGCRNFNSTCEALIKLNESLSEKSDTNE